MNPVNTNVIEWTNPGFDEILWSNSETNIRWGTSLVVKEWESAIFMRDGKLFDIFGPGRHILSTQNIPLLTQSYNFLMGYKETPFKVNIIFISGKMFTGNWGVQTMVTAAEGIPAPIPLKAHGNYQYRVDDPILFVTQMTGGLKYFDTNSVARAINGFINEKLMQDFSQYTYMDVYANLEKTSTIVQVNISDLLRQRGIELLTLKIIGVDTEEQYKEDMYKFIRFNSPGGMEYRKFETLDKMAESIGKSGGAAVGTGMMLFPQMYQNLISQQDTIPVSSSSKPTEQITNSLSICPFCGRELKFSKTPRFCPYCRENIEVM